MARGAEWSFGFGAAFEELARTTRRLYLRYTSS